MKEKLSKLFFILLNILLIALYSFAMYALGYGRGFRDGATKTFSSYVATTNTFEIEL